MKRALALFAWALAHLALAGCQQPQRCGAYGEPCCAVGDARGCFAPLQCELGRCIGRCRAAIGCDIAGQLGCDDGQGCYIDATPGTPACFAAGSAEVGQTCAVDTDCRPGNYCHPYTTRCTPHCCAGDEAPCGTLRECLVTSRSTAGLCILTGECDLFGGGGDCPAGEGCYPVLNPALSLFAPTCAPAGFLGVDEECSGTTECAPGLTCVRDRGCQRLCDPLESGSCGGARCLAFIDMELPTGFCAP